jgi:hypothetical protein
MPVPVYFGPQYLALPRPETPWLVHSLIPRDGSLLMYSAPKQGKSTALLQLASAISNPKVGHFLGLPILQHGPVGIVQLDTPSGLWASEYVGPMSEQLNIDQVAFADRDVMPPESYPFNIRTSAHAGWLREWCSTFNPVCVIIDTWRELFRGEERDSDTNQQVMAALWKAITPAAVVLVHHSRKIDPKHPSEHVSEDARGSTYLTGKVDVICQFSRKRWKIQGRGGDMTLKTIRDKDTGLISLDGPPLTLIAQTIADPSYASDRMRAVFLHEQLGISVEAARHRIKDARRVLAAT